MIMSTINYDHEDNLQDQRDEILALQSIYNTDDNHRLMVNSEVEEDGSGVFSIAISVCVKPVADKMTVRIALPCKQDEEEEAMGATASTGVDSELPKLPPKVTMNRSLSGSKWEGMFELKYLSPLMLYLTFPKSYPSHEAPEYHLNCAWMTLTQTETLSAVLDQMWTESASMPIVFTWIDWLENNVLEHLGLTDSIVLCPRIPLLDAASGGTHSEDVWSCEEEIGDIVATLVQYNREQCDLEFCQNRQTCEVCFDEKPGTQFYKIHECDHKFCHDCVTAFCEMHVTAGTVEELRCPDFDCTALLPPYVVQAVLPAAAFERWEKLLLQRTLDAMADTTYCPRCQSLVIQEQEEDMQLAVCTVCMFAFCTECERAWHQGSPCQGEGEQLKEIEDRMSRTKKAEQKRYEEMLAKLQEEMLSKAAQSQTTKKCPNCKIPVEKNGGCNKMTCKCGQFFCWLCGSKIKGYDHYYVQGDCALVNYQPATPMRLQRQPNHAALRMRARLELNPELRNKQVKCPTCKQNLFKDNQNNHLKCWNCKVNLCFLCKEKIIGPVTDHFNKGVCVQHSP